MSLQTWKAPQGREPSEAISRDGVLSQEARAGGLRREGRGGEAEQMREMTSPLPPRECVVLESERKHCFREEAEPCQMLPTAG